MSTGNGADESFDTNEFLVAGPCWLVAWKKGISETGAVNTGAILRLNPGTEKDPATAFVAAFTDLDLAERFVNGQGPRADQLGVFRSATLDDFAALLEMLQRGGVARIGFDPEKGHVRIIPIERVLDGIRNRRR
jgi:hypothetical protein